MNGPLSGLRVIDCSTGMAGPRASGLLADYGADVVWVEPPGGDPARTELAIPYATFNRGKRSIELELELASPEGRDQLWALLASADVLVESWAPGEGDALGFGYESVHGRVPTLVHCSLTGFGPDGSWCDVPPREALVHALVGTMGEQVGHRDGPIYEGLPFASIGAAYLAAIGVLAAVYRGGRDGWGRHVETSLLDGALAYLSMGWGDTDDVAAQPLAAGSYRLVAGSFRCGDDQYIGVHSGAVGAFGRLMSLIGLDDRIPPSPDGLDMGVPLDPEHKQMLDAEIHKIFASQPRDVWVQRMRDADVCAVPHLHPGEVFDAPQARHNQMSVMLDDPVLGPVEQVAPPAKLTATPGRVRGPAPRAGQHTAEILSELGSRTSRPAPTTAPDAELPLLHDLRILDLGAYYAGPYSSRLLADLGADVIKLEPVQGDQMRGLLGVFRSAQAGKRSLAANLKDPELDRARRSLIEWADVVHHNMRPGAAERLGLGYEQVRELHPDAVYLYAPGWGSSGPDRDRQSFAPMLSGYVGASFEVGGQYNAPLHSLGNEDPGNGLLGAAAILMCLIHRQRTGDGQLVENPQLNASMAHMAHIVRRPDGTVLGAERLDALQYGVGPLDRLYETADGWLCLVASGDAELDALAEVTGVEIRADARFATPEAREAHAYELGGRLSEALGERATADWLAAFAEAGVPAAEPAPYNNATFLRDPEHQSSGRAAECPHPTQGHVREVGTLLRVSDARTPSHRLAPDLGEHSEQVLRWLGYTPEHIAGLRECGSLR